jgi:hypothetical protein
VAPEQGAILDKERAPPTSGVVRVGADKEEGRGTRQLRKRWRGGSSVEAASSEESSTARSRQRPAKFRCVQPVS